jgi:hypothetical protein
MRLLTVVCLACLTLVAAIAAASDFQRAEGVANANAVSRSDAGRAFTLGNQASEFTSNVNTVPAGALKFTADAPAVGIAAGAYMKLPTDTAKQFSAFAQGESLVAKVMGAAPQDLNLQPKRLPRGTARSLMRYSGESANWFDAMGVFNTPAARPQALANPMKAACVVDDPSALGLTVISRD